MLVAEDAEGGLAVTDVGDVDEADEMDAFEIKALPAVALCAFAETLEVALAAVDEVVVLAGDVERLLGFDGLHRLGDGVEFLGFGEMREIASVKDERRRSG